MTSSATTFASVGVINLVGGVAEMTDGVSDVVVAGSEGARAGEGFEALAGLNEGFLGTGYSTSVEISFLAMVLIGVYVAFSTARYFLHGSRLLAAVTGALGFQR